MTPCSQVALPLGCWCGGKSACEHTVKSKGYLDGKSAGWYKKKPVFRQPTDPLPKVGCRLQKKLQRPVPPNAKKAVCLKKGIGKRGKQKRERGEAKNRLWRDEARIYGNREFDLYSFCFAHNCLAVVEGNIAGEVYVQEVPDQQFCPQPYSPRVLPGATVDGNVVIVQVHYETPNGNINDSWKNVILTI